MLGETIDLELLSSFDVCIVGSGFAGMRAALNLSKHGARVLVLEAGPIESDDGGDSYELEVTGLAYPKSGTRLAGLGGTSGHWGGQSFPLSPRCFSNRNGITGWPIFYRELSSYLDDASVWLNLSKFRRSSSKTSIETGIFSQNANLAVDRFHVSRPIVRLGEQKEDLEKNERIFILYNTRVVDIVLNEEKNSILHLVALSKKSGKRFKIPVKNVILACGGIETPRLMLAAGRKYLRGNPLLGGRKEITGKYFMEHPHIDPVKIYFDARADLSDTAWHLTNAGHYEAAVWRPDDKFIEQYGLARFGVFFWNSKRKADGDKLLKESNDYYLEKCDQYIVSEPTFLFEQEPIVESFVGLSKKNDKFGEPIALLNWKISDADFYRYYKSIVTFSSLVSQYGNARVFIEEDYANRNYEKWSIGWGCHHMGTTRMSNSPADGVVDKNCKVHGIANLYIAGSSVFTNSDYVNPTLNLVALTDRLCEHLLVSGRVIVSELIFGIGKYSNSRLLKGWAEPEAEGVWTSGTRGSVIDIGKVPRKKLILRGRSFDVGQHVTKIIVYLGDDKIYEGRASDFINKEYKIKRQPRSGLLRIKVLNAKSPKELGLSSDKRKLGVFAMSLKVD